MSLLDVANEDWTIDLKEAPGTSATLTPVTAVSTKVKAVGKGVYRGDIVVNITNATDGIYTQNPPTAVPATIAPTAVKIKADGLEVIRVDDEAPLVAVPGIDGGGNPGTIDVTVYVSDAGQTKVKAQ